MPSRVNVSKTEGCVIYKRKIEDVHETIAVTSFESAQSSCVHDGKAECVNHGFEQVRNVPGSWKAWQAADYETENHTLQFPFDLQEFWNALEEVEMEAKWIWDEINIGVE